MANLKFAFACFFVLVLIFCQGTQSTEGRKLIAGMKKGYLELKTHVKLMEKETTKSLPTTSPSDQIAANSQPPASDHAEAFRPTSPGHSPGIGHSLQN